MNLVPPLLGYALLSSCFELPVGATCMIVVASTLNTAIVVQRAPPHGSHTTCIMLTSISVNAVECYPATVLSSVHPIPIRSLALHDACQQQLWSCIDASNANTSITG